MFNSKAMSFIASHYVVEDESWFVWDQKERRNAWIEKKQTKPTVARAKITKRKTMLLVAITCKPKRYLPTLLPQDIQLTQMLHPVPQGHPKTLQPGTEKPNRPKGYGSSVGQCPSPHVQQNHDLFEAGGDSATKTEPVLA